MLIHNIIEVSVSSENLKTIKFSQEERKRLGQPRQLLTGMPVKSFFDFIGMTEVTRGARLLALDSSQSLKIKQQLKGKGRFE
jgi:hypothetical protein